MTESKASTDDRLDSWKAIARYLNRDVRTVRRWEKGEGLPVQRHLHEKRASVYAFKTDLDDWWENRRPADSSAKQAEAARTRVWLTASGVLAILIAIIALLYPQQPTLTFQERDWILITDFNNQTGEEILDGTIEFALERSLSGSSFVNVTPQPRIADTLSLMQRPPDTELNPLVAREIAIRDGGIRGIVTGRAEKLGSSYVISVSVMEPQSGAIVSTYSEEAPDQGSILPAVDSIANQLRADLGETLPELPRDPEDLAKVTTQSLKAVQLYSRGLDLLYLNQQQASRDYLERAVTEDPEFATAHIFLAWVNDNLGYESADPEDKHKSAYHFEKAFELADRTSDRERLFILGSYYQAYEPDLEKAAQHYKTLLRYYPDDYWANNNLAILLHRHGRIEESVPYAMAMADARPNALFPSLVAAQVLAATGRMSEAQPYLDTIHRMGQTIQGLAGDETAWAHFMFYRVYAPWAEGDLDRATNALAWVQRNSQPPDESARSALAQISGLYYLATGELNKAEQEFQRISTEDKRAGETGPVTAPLWGHMEDNEDPDFHESMAWLAFASDDKDALREHLIAGRPLMYTAVLLPRVGLITEAERAVAELLEHATHPDEYRKTLANTIRGAIALRQGNYDVAVSLLSGVERDLRLPRSYLTTLYLLTAETLADAYLATDKPGEAAAALDRAAEIRNVTFYWQESSGYPWIRVQSKRATVHRKLHNFDIAEAIEADLQRQLAHADASFPPRLAINE